MSNQQWPSNANVPGNPWAAPQPATKHAARDPRVPFGQQPLAAQSPGLPTLSEPPQNKKPGLFVFLAVLVIAAALLSLQFSGNSAGPSASESPSTQSAPTASRSGNWIPFEGNGSGIFELTNYTWTETGVTVTIKVEVSRGEYNFGLFAFTNATRSSYEPLANSRFTVSAGSPYVGTFKFNMPKEDSTLVLTTPSGRTALNALPIKA